jgi:hypothetical protein
MLADALTKIVMAKEIESHEMLKIFNSKAYIIYSEDKVMMLGGSI